MSTARIGLLLLTIALAVIFLIWLGSTRESPTTTDNPTEATTSPSPTINEVADWPTYTSDEIGFTVNYPSDFQVIDTQPGAVTFLRLGPTQAQGTELFDGASITFDSGEFEGEFEDFVGAQWRTAQEDPTTLSITDLSPLTINGVPGYGYSLSALGDFTVVYLPKGENEYLRISYIVADPGSLGFQEDTNTLLSTITLE